MKVNNMSRHQGKLKEAECTKSSPHSMQKEHSTKQIRRLANEEKPAMGTEAF